MKSSNSRDVRPAESKKNLMSDAQAGQVTGGERAPPRKFSEQRRLISTRDPCENEWMWSFLSSTTADEIAEIE